VTPQNSAKSSTKSLQAKTRSTRTSQHTSTRSHRHHREHAFADITIGLLLAINEINHTHNPDTEATTELIWRLMYAAAQLEKIRP
jgi:hypothetical protein